MQEIKKDDDLAGISSKMTQEVMEDRRTLRTCNICLECIAKIGHPFLTAPKSKMKYCVKCGKELPKQ